jgi:hypothetical protein
LSSKTAKLKTSATKSSAITSKEETHKKANGADTPVSIPAQTEVEKQNDRAYKRKGWKE